MPRQIDRQHGKAQVERPFDHMAIQAAVVVIAMQQQQGRPRRLRAPDLGGNPVSADLEIAEQTALGRQLRETVETPVRLLMRQGRRRGGQGAQIGDQICRLKTF
ncbi:hypothetical protein D9M68_755260 [compost metagenome]